MCGCANKIFICTQCTPITVEGKIILSHIAAVALASFGQHCSRRLLTTTSSSPGPVLLGRILRGILADKPLHYIELMVKTRKSQRNCISELEILSVSKCSKCWIYCVRCISQLCFLIVCSVAYNTLNIADIATR